MKVPDHNNRVFYDTEFVDDGERIHLISIGAVKENGDTFYAVLNDWPMEKCTPWLMENVVRHLPDERQWEDPEDVRPDLLEFMGLAPQFWAWYGAYDHVALMQLYGPMIQKPDSWPMYSMDLKMLAELQGNPKLPKQVGTAHDALEDAKWNRQVFEFLTEYAK